MKNLSVLSFFIDFFKKKKKSTVKECLDNPEFSRTFIYLADKINSDSSEPQIIKIGEKYFKVRELG